MFGNNKKSETQDLRECKKCFRIVPVEQMSREDRYSSPAKICSNCTEIVGNIASKAAIKAEVAKYERTIVTVSDLPKGPVGKGR